MQFPRCRAFFTRRAVRVALVFIVAGGGWWICGLWTYGLTERVPVTTLTLPITPPDQQGWVLENAFPHLKFANPICVAFAARDPQRLYVLEHRGVVHAFLNDRATTSQETFLDISSRVYLDGEAGALGLAFHPEFGQPASPHRGELFLFYTTSRGQKHYDRLSRFNVPDGAQAADPASEVVLIDQLDDDAMHNAGCLQFGTDGFLYVSVGDEGGGRDKFQNSQRIDRDLFSGVLRIDVDCRGDVSHAPQRQPATGSTAHYFIPNDNPFVGQPKALEEFWAVGLRNPHRMAFDRETGRLWVGDAGEDSREEINWVEKGSNHQWCYWEGSVPDEKSRYAGVKPTPYFGHESPPVFDYLHSDGDGCVIGGFIYRGAQHPEWHGKYLFGDFGSGRVWTLDWAEKNSMPSRQFIAQVPAAMGRLAAFAEDFAGEALLCIHGAQSGLWRLAKAPPAEPVRLPERLSETGVFQDLRTLTPNPGILPYTVNVPLWSDGAVKQRWIALPGDGTSKDTMTDRIRFYPTDSWVFPAGTVFIKHFELPIDAARPEVRKRLETRILVRDTTGGVYGLTYRWNASGTDAILLEDGLDEEIEVRDADNDRRTQTWHYPSRGECLVCHNSSAGYVLGVNTRQLNCNFEYPSGIRDNQLRAWNHIGLLTAKNHEVRPLKERKIWFYPRLAALDSWASVENKARSYIDANCAYCHRPGGVRAQFDARYEFPLAEQNLIGGMVHNHLNIAGAQAIHPGQPAQSLLYHRMASRDRKVAMPPVGSNMPDEQAVELVAQWISRLEAPSKRSSPHCKQLPADNNPHR